MSECTRLLQSIHIRRDLVTKTNLSSLRQNYIIFHDSSKLQNNETSKTRLVSIVVSPLSVDLNQGDMRTLLAMFFRCASFVKGKLLISREFLSPDHFKILLWFQITCTLYDTFIGDGNITFPHLLLSAIYI